MADGREEREELEKRIEQQKREDREDWIDRDNLDIGTAGLDDRPQDVATDTTEAIDCDLDCHVCCSPRKIIDVMMLPCIPTIPVDDRPTPTISCKVSSAPLRTLPPRLARQEPEQPACQPTHTALSIGKRFRTLEPMLRVQST